MLTFAIFPMFLFVLGAALVTGLPLAVELQAYYANRGRRSVICPGNGQRVDVELDHRYALKTAFRNHQQSRLESCTRWPEQGDCGQECLVQVDPTPENVERLLTKWYEGKHCAICTRRLGPSDWQRSRLAVLNQQHEIFELRQMHLDELQSALEHMHPLCWNCHQEERARQAPPARILRGERAGMQPAYED